MQLRRVEPKSLFYYRYILPFIIYWGSIHSWRTNIDSHYIWILCRSPQKRQQSKKIFPRKPPRNANFEPTVAEESDSENSNTDSIPIMNPETAISDNTGAIVAAEHPNDSNSNKLIFLKETRSAVCSNYYYFAMSLVYAFMFRFCCLTFLNI